MTAYASNWMTTTSRSDQVALQPLRGSQGGGGAPLATYRWPESPLLKICPRSNDNNNSNTHIDESSVSLLEDRVGPNCARSHPFHAFIQGASRVRLFGWPVDRSLGTFALGRLNRSTDRGEMVRGRSLFGDPGLAHAFENARFFILVADVHRRVAPIRTSIEWLLLFASHQNVINSRKMLGLV
jgi:hypothetical protein